MWDEKKFFEDYVEDTNKVKPDKDFVDNLKKLTLEDTNAKKSSMWIKYAAIAAVIMLFMGVGFMAWKIPHNKNGQETDFSNNVHAGHDKEIQSGGTMIITIKTILSYMEDGSTIVEDTQGNAIEEDVRSDLIEMLKKAVSTDAGPTEDMKYDEYICKGATDISLKVYEEGYIVIKNNGMIYKVN